MKTYEITEQLSDLFSRFEAGEIDETTFRDTVEASLEDDLKESLNRIAWVVREASLDEAKYKEVAAEFSAKAKAKAAVQTRLKAIALDWLRKIDQEKIKTEHFTVARQSNPPKLASDEGAEPPDDLIIVTVTPDSQGIKDAIIAGREIPGFRIEQGEHLRIR